jgi:hypothetical protein
MPNLKSLETEIIHKNFPIERKKIEIYSPIVLSHHFPDAAIPLVKTEMLEIAEDFVDEGPSIINDWKYISMIMKSDEKFYYFKNVRSNQILTLKENIENDNWTLIRIEDDSFVLKFKETLCKVLKK